MGFLPLLQNIRNSPQRLRLRTYNPQHRKLDIHDFRQ
jgi:ribosomal protein L33